MTKSPFLAVSTRLGAFALSVLVPLAAPAPAAPQGQGRGGGQQGAASESPAVVPFVDPATLVRDMTRQQVTAGGKTEQKVVVPARYCSGLVANGSKIVNLPDIRWGLRTTTPVAVTRRAKATLQWPGQQKRDEPLPDGMPGSSERAFTFSRPGPRSIQVTLLQVGGGGTQAAFGDGSVRTVRDSVTSPSALPTKAPSSGSGTRTVTDGTSNTITAGERAPSSGTSGIKDGTSNTVMVGEAARPAQTVCVSDVFVLDPPVEVLVNVTGPPGQGDTDRRTTF